MTEPMVSFARGAFWINAGCLKRSPETIYVHFLILRSQRKLILKLCSEEELDAVRWCTPSGKPRKILCNEDFFGDIFTLIDWNHNNRYRLLGRMIASSGWMGFAFDLTRAEVFPLTGVNSKDTSEPSTHSDTGKPFGEIWNQHCCNPLINKFLEDTVIMIN